MVALIESQGMTSVTNTPGALSTVSSGAAGSLLNPFKIVFQHGQRWVNDSRLG